MLQDPGLGIILIQMKVDYNKNGNIYAYYDLDEILKNSIFDNVKEIFKKMFNKRVFFEYRGNCKIGKLIGLEINHKLSMQYYIIKSEDQTLYIPINRSITLV